MTRCASERINVKRGEIYEDYDEYIHVIRYLDLDRGDFCCDEMCNNLLGEGDGRLLSLMWEKTSQKSSRSSKVMNGEKKEVYNAPSPINKSTFSRKKPPFAAGVILII
ncbi:4997_t:CDS:2, partial [Ambispora leptoticha]